MNGWVPHLAAPPRRGGAHWTYFFLRLITPKASDPIPNSASNGNGDAVCGRFPPCWFDAVSVFSAALAPAACCPEVWSAADSLPLGIEDVPWSVLVVVVVCVF